MSRWNVYLLRLGLFSNIIILVSLRFTVRAQVWEKLCRRSGCCCLQPSLDGDSSTRSSANSRHLIPVSTSVMPGAANCSNLLASWLMQWFSTFFEPQHTFYIYKILGHTTNQNEIKRHNNTVHIIYIVVAICPQWNNNLKIKKSNKAT